eukprot:SRR837773.25856.p1 GENE.SRR837773.25856~~SRR837773.25856.p1  ORF type:complete len:144 (-),score=41.71 SRR837773.25856:18-392(-)
MGFLVVYDITDRTSFANVRRWIEEIKKYGSGDVPWLLVGNKCDQGSKRVITYDEAKDLADELGAKFLETSAKNAHNIEEAFRSMAEEVLASRASTGPRARPGSTVPLAAGTPLTAGRRGLCCYS